MALLVGVVLSMPIAYVIGRPIMKLRGFVLAMASLAMQLIFIVLAIEIGVRRRRAGNAWRAEIRDLRHLVRKRHRVLLRGLGDCASSASRIGLNIDRSRIGRALKAIAASETAAGSVGIDAVKYKVQMFVVSAGMASVAGSLGAHYLRAMDPNVYGFAYSLNLLTGVIIGGLTSVWGGALGATVDHRACANCCAACRCRCGNPSSWARSPWSC